MYYLFGAMLRACNNCFNNHLNPFIMLHLLPDYQKHTEEQNDHLHGLKLLKDRCTLQLGAVNNEAAVDSDLKDYFKLKLVKLSDQIARLEDQIINNTFDKWLIKYRISQAVNANHKNHCNNDGGN